MGSIDASKEQLKMTKSQFEFISVIGKGGFGKVWKVRYLKTNKLYALKEMSKVKIIHRKSESNIISEKELLSSLGYNPFISNVICSFQDADNLYLVMDLLTGGDLRYHLNKYKRFNERQTKFFMACIILGLEYIHSHNIIHRDIKPENLVFDHKGYLRIIDFGIAQKKGKNNKHQTSGTPAYMAPEVLCSKEHSFPVDYYGLGVIGYECMLGTRPYQGNTKRDMRHSIIATQAKVYPNEVPIGWSYEAAELINELLQRSASIRLGSGPNGINEIKNHEWFKDYNWYDLSMQRTISPFIPFKEDNINKLYCQKNDSIGLETAINYQLYQEDPNYSSLFNNYTYFNNQHIDVQTIRPSSPQIKELIDPPSVKRSSSNKNVSMSLKLLKVNKASCISNQKKKLFIAKRNEHKNLFSSLEKDLLLPSITSKRKTIQQSKSALCLSSKTNDTSLVVDISINQSKLHQSIPLANKLKRTLKKKNYTIKAKRNSSMF